LKKIISCYYFQEFDVGPTVCAAIFGVMAFLEAVAIVIMGVRARRAAAAAATAPGRAAAVAATARLARVAPFALAVRARASEEATAPSAE
jgi:hypothetical protein